jgi:hypothetical protein
MNAILRAGVRFQRSAWRFARGLDMWFTSMVVAFLIALPLPGGWPGLLPYLASPRQPRAFTDFDAAIAGAAVKSPATARPLTSLDTSKPEIEVIKFGYIGTLDGKTEKGSQLKEDYFVALPDEVKQRCQGAAEPQGTLQRILGLQPSVGTRPAWLLTIPTQALFRPCLSTDSIAATECTASPPSDLATMAADDPRRKHFEFVARTLMTSYRVGFTRNVANPSDYPFDGYPFTGMGYTYDWGTSANGHFGVNEFIVAQGTILSAAAKVDLGAFCAGTP